MIELKNKTYPLGEINGISLSFMRGKKGEGDMIVLIDGKKLSQQHILMIVKLIYMIEDRLFPPGKGKGGKYFLDAIRNVIKEKDIIDVMEYMRFPETSIHRVVGKKFNRFCEEYEKVYPSPHKKSDKRISLEDAFK